MWQKVVTLVALVALWGTVSAATDDVLDLSCVHEDDCETFNSTTVRSTCTNGVCHCEKRDGGNQTVCVPVYVKGSLTIGGQCPCLMENAYCNEKTNQCACREGYYPNKGSIRAQCYQTSVELGKHCEYDEQCINNDSFSHCDDAQQTCGCSNHFVPYKNECQSIIASGDKPCQQDKDCAGQVENSICYEKQCICGLQFVANAENTTCLPKVHYEAECSDSNQCIARLGVGSLCSEGKCICNEKHHPFRKDGQNSTNQEQYCKPINLLGIYCGTDDDCYQPHLEPHKQSMECFNGECFCAKGFVENSAGVCENPNNSSALHLPSLVTFFLWIAAVYSKHLFTC